MALNLLEIATKALVASKPLRDNFTDIENFVNDLENQIDLMVTPPTGSEVTDARDYHTVLRDRMRSASKSLPAVIISGGATEEQGTPDMTVHVTALEAIVDGVACKIAASNSGTITAPTTDPRYDIIVVNSDSTLSVVAGTEDADPVYPTISSTQKPIAILKLYSGMTAIANADIIDCRDQGAFYQSGGAFRYKYAVQDAIDDIDAGEIIIGRGTYIEDLTLKNAVKMIAMDGAVIDGTISGSANPVLKSIRRQVFTASGTWYKPEDVAQVKVVCVGAGGSGGAGKDANSGGGGAGGGGGGAGGYFEGIVSVSGDATVTVSSTTTSFGSINVDVGENGADGVANTGGGAGGAGANATGVLGYALAGGAGGNYATAGGYGAGGGGGGDGGPVQKAANGGAGFCFIGGSGPINLPSGGGMAGGSGGGGAGGFGGAGGDGGQGGAADLNGNAGSVGIGYGAGGGGGGGGGGTANTALGAAGGAGGAGICIVEWEQ